MRIMVATCTLAALLLALACDSGGKELRSLDFRPSCTNQATVTAMETSKDFDILLRVPDDEPRCRARPALLTLADLPDGWTERQDFAQTGGALPGRGDPSRGEAAECRVLYPEFSAGLRAEYEVTSSKGGFDSLLYHELRLLKPGSAEDLFDALEHSCNLLAADPGYFEGYREPAALDIGDEAFAIEIATGDDAQLTQIVFVRRGDLVSKVLLFGPGPAVEPLAQVADARVSQLRPIPQPTEEPNADCPEARRPVEISGEGRILEEALVALEDLPVGWVRYRPDACDRLPETAYCRPPLEGTGPLAVSLFERKPIVVAHSVFVPSDVEVTMRDLRARMASSRCEATYEGETLEWTVVATTAPDLGDESLLTRFSTRLDGRALFYGYQLVTRRGAAVSAVIWQRPGFPPEGDVIDATDGLVLDLAIIADRKLAEVERQLREQ